MRLPSLSFGMVQICVNVAGETSCTSNPKCNFFN